VIGRTLDELKIGDSADLSRQVSQQDITAFVGAVGDTNPLHSDAAFAAGTRFKGIIAPGILTAGLISGVIGTRLPGFGTVYLSQDLKFHEPVRPGDTITARVEVIEIIAERKRIKLKTTCSNQHGTVVVSGEAMVMPPSKPAPAAS
jgi:acyl dehydratase